jgi:hypothetical protein
MSAGRIEVTFVDKSTTPSGGPTTSTQETTGPVGIDLTKMIDLGCGWAGTAFHRRCADERAH